jgi:hypothetical protein
VDQAPPEAGHIVVGVDGSELSDVAMTFACEAAEAVRRCSCSAPEGVDGSPRACSAR